MLEVRSETWNDLVVVFGVRNLVSRFVHAPIPSAVLRHISAVATTVSNFGGVDGSTIRIFCSHLLVPGLGNFLTCEARTIARRLFGRLDRRCRLNGGLIIGGNLHAVTTIKAALLGIIRLIPPEGMVVTLSLPSCETRVKIERCVGTDRKDSEMRLADEKSKSRASCIACDECTTT